MKLEYYPDCEFVAKKDSRLMRLISFFYPSFATNFWTTIGNRIYYPDSVNLTLKNAIFYMHIIEHELVHVKQFKKYSVPLFLFLYVFFPLPIFFSYFRWKFEREAYLVNLKFNYVDAVELNQDIENVVSILHSSYFMPWPKSWMRKWFKEETERMIKNKTLF